MFNHFLKNFHCYWMIVGSTLWQQSFFHLLSYLLSIWFYYTQNIPSKHSSWWRRLEDVFCLRLQKTLQDKHIRYTYTSPEDVLIKTNIFVLVIRLQDVFKKYWKNVFKTSSRRFQDVFKTSSRRLQNVFEISSRRPQDVFKMFWRRLQDIFKTSSRRLAKIFSRGFQGVPSS